MGRTNIVIDDRLIRQVMRLYGFRSKREAVDHALRRLASPHSQRDMLDLEGVGWEGNLEEMRTTRFPER